MNSIKKYWDHSVSYSDYLKNSEARIHALQQSKKEEEKEFLQYYQLGKTRMNRVDKTYHPDEGQLKKLETKNFTGKILIISEGWCGDAAMIVPVLHAFFGDDNVRLVYRDENEDLINQYLTNGGKAIPIVLLLDEKAETVVAHWGPRPVYGMELLKKHKTDPSYSADEFHTDLQLYYTKNKGVDIVEEILNLL